LPVPAAKNHDALLFQMTNRAAPDVHLGDLSHFDGGLHARMNFEFFESVLQGKGVDDGASIPM
jgi:hypothetical protein